MKPFVAKDAEILDSSVGDGSQLFRSSKIVSSKLENNVTVGDFSRIIESTLDGFVRIDRQNLIYHSHIDTCSYTGSSDVIMHARIGKYCSISWGVTIGPGEHDYNNITSHDFLYNDYYGIRPQGAPFPYDRFASPCILGNDVWIGANATVLRNVTIGNGAIVGANSVVTKDVPPYAIVAGCPARVVKYRFSEEVICKLNNLEWWNLPKEIIRSNFDLFKDKKIDIAITELERIKSLL